MADTDEPTRKTPILRALEQEAIRLYRAEYPSAPPWQELDTLTRTVWVCEAERQRNAGWEGKTNG